MRRIALLSIFKISDLTVAEKSISKPFNPLLGETFEFKNQYFEFLAE